MSRECDLSGKKPLVGNKVSHAGNRSKTRQAPNLQKKRIYVPEKDRWVTVKISARALRTINKKGLMQFLEDEGLSLDDVTS
ncbi:MAG: 50S ribosomal protein L28 [Bradymonadaceae bacterium]